jgi:hypothetical protein
VTSHADIVLRSPADPKSPGGVGPGPFEAAELHSTCTASESGATGSATFVNGNLWTSTESGGEPKDQEAVPDSPPVNYTRSGIITNVGDVFTVVYNEQVPNADGSLTVTAIHAYLFGPTAVGELVEGQVTCGTDPHPAVAADTEGPRCGPIDVEPVSPTDPTPKDPRVELIGVFDARGLQSITNIQSTNATVQVGDPNSAEDYLKHVPGQTGPLPITATANGPGPMTWSFDATDVAGNVTHSSQCPTLSERIGTGFTPTDEISTGGGGGDTTGGDTTGEDTTGGTGGTSSGGGSGAAGQLGKTGMEVLRFVLTATALVVLGFVIVTVSRRRRVKNGHPDGLSSPAEDAI